MTRLEKILLAIEKGITCDPITGKVYGVRGKEILRKSKGYIDISVVDEDFKYNNKMYHLAGHHFIYYSVHKKVVDYIDHINGIRDDNRIDNLRSVTNQQNAFNTKAKGYYRHRNKWMAYIALNGKMKNLGCFDTEQEAHGAYLDAKEIYHII
jgi:hypothetical protein